MHVSTISRHRVVVGALLATLALLASLFVTVPSASAGEPQKDGVSASAAGQDAGALAGDPVVSPMYSGEYVIRDVTASDAYNMVTNSNGRNWCLVDEFCFYQREGTSNRFSVFSLKNCNQRSISNFLETTGRTVYNHQTRIPATARLKDTPTHTAVSVAPGAKPAVNWYPINYIDIC